MDRSDRDDEIRSWAGGGNWDNPDRYENPPEPPPSPRSVKRAPEPVPPDFGAPRRRAKSGLVCGRFMPLHRGHELLIDFALYSVEQLTVLVFEAPEDLIPGALRVRWLRERFPSANVPDAVPQLAAAPDAMDFPFAFASLVERTLKAKPECFFSSDASGVFAAMALGATYVPVDPTRALVPISGQEIRGDVVGRFEHIAAVARPWFVRRIAVVGAESTGKSTLVKQLAADHGVPYVSEYLRTLVDGKSFGAQQVQLAARGQIAAEDAMAGQGGHVLFCDTDVRTVRLWSERLFQGQAPEWIAGEVARRPYDLTLLLDREGIPFVGARERDDPEARRLFHDRLAAELTGPVVTISGRTWDSRTEAARREVFLALRKRKLFGARGETMLYPG